MNRVFSFSINVRSISLDDIYAVGYIIKTFNLPEIPIEEYERYRKYKLFIQNNPICKSTKTPEKPQ